MARVAEGPHTAIILGLVPTWEPFRVSDSGTPLQGPGPEHWDLVVGKASRVGLGSSHER